MLIRAMEAGDLGRICEIADGLPMAPQWPQAVYAEAVLSERRVALVAEASGGVVGFLVAGVVAPEAEVESIAVAAEWQGRGVGSALLRALIESDGIEELVLEVRASNTAAQRLYLRAGFVETGRRRGYYAGPVEDAVLLGLKVGMKQIPFGNDNQ